MFRSISLSLFTIGGGLKEMSTKAVQQETYATKLIAQCEQVGQKLLALADEMPANKFEFKPIESARPLEEVLRHVAYWNYYVADSARGKTPDDSGNELPKEKFSTKVQIIKALKQSVTDACTALKVSRKLTPDTMDLIVMFLAHNSEHYGQLAVYARLNGIVPPASRNS
jgi:uncharacterized damage-inducible protein DinB